MSGLSCEHGWHFLNADPCPLCVEAIRKARLWVTGEWYPFAMWCVLAYDIWAAKHGPDQHYPARESWEELGEMITVYGARALMEDEQGGQA